MNHNSDQIDYFLRGELDSEEVNPLYQAILEAAPNSNSDFMLRLEIQLMEQTVAETHSKASIPSRLFRQWHLVATPVLVFTVILFIALLVAYLNRYEVANPAQIHRLTQTPVPISQMALEPITPENVHRLTHLASYGHGRISHLDWSPDGQWIAASGGRGVWLLDAARLESEPVLLPYSAELSELRFSPDNRLLAVNDYGKQQIVIWDVATHQVVKKLSSEAAQPMKLAFSSDSKYLAVAFLHEEQQTSHLSVWQIPDDLTAPYPEILHYIADDIIGSLAFQPHEPVLAYGSGKPLYYSPTPYHLTLLNLEGQVVTTIETENTGLNALNFSPDGAWLIGVDQTFAHIWEVETGEEIYHLTQLPESLINVTSAELMITEVGMTPDQQYVLMPSINVGLLRWDVGENEVEVLTLPDHKRVWAHRMALSPDGKQVAVMDDMVAIHTWKVATGEYMGTANQFHGGDVALSHDTKLLAINNEDETLRLIDTTTGAEIRSFAYQFNNRSNLSIDPHISKLRFSPDDRWLVGYGALNSVNYLGIWDRTRDVFQTYTVNLNLPMGLAALEFVEKPEGGWLVALGVTAFGDIALVDVTTGEMISKLHHPNPAPTYWNFYYSPVLQFDKAHNQLIAIGSDATVKTWDLDSGEAVNAFTFPTTAEVLSLPTAISADKTLYFEDIQTVHILDLHTQAIIHTLELESSNSSVISAGFSGDGSVLFLSKYNQRYAWDMNTGLALPLPLDFAQYAGFSSQYYERIIMTIGLNGSLDVWGVPQE